MNVTLEDEIDISRGDVLVDDAQRPFIGSEFQATLVWMHADPLDLHKIYLLKHTTRTVRARIKQVRHRIDVNTLEKSPATSLDMNDIAEVDIKTTLPLFFDPYRVNRTMGSFIIIDQHTNATVAAGIIERAVVPRPRDARRSHCADRPQHRRKSEFCDSATPPPRCGCKAARAPRNCSSAACSRRAGSCSWSARWIFSRTS